jgi:serine phosphatase RsbU (regulator of sigma subunit)
MNSGHVPALLIQKSGINILSQYANTLLGHSDEVQTAEIVTKPLDNIHTILLFSDGLLDATTPKGRTPSLRILTKLIKSGEDQSASDLRKLLEIRCAVQMKSDSSGALRDDVSFIVVKINDKASISTEKKDDAA